MDPTTALKKRLPDELTGVTAPGGYSFDELYRFAQVCHASGLFEDTTDAAQAMVKIVRGAELGLPPTTAMTAFDIIRKRLFVKPWVIAAKIQSCGYGAFRVQEQTNERCVIVFRRKDPVTGWYDCPDVTYTFEEARAHGLVERSPHWKASPAHMLFQRCMGRGGAMYFPELLAGLIVPQDDTPVPPERHAQNVIDLYGETRGEPTPTEAPAVDTRTGEVLEAPTAPPPATMWRETLTAHQDHPALPAALRSKVKLALHPGSDVSASRGLGLASTVLDVVDAAGGEGEQ